jgi:hypothetical protein
MAVCAVAAGFIGCKSNSHKEVRTYEYHGDPARQHQTAEPVSEEYQMQSPGEMVSPGEMQSPGRPVVDPKR